MRDCNKIVQGDVILRKISNLPENVVPVEGSILQQSETTGHHHFFEKTANCKIYQKKVEACSASATVTPNDLKFVVIGDVAVLHHGCPQKFPSSTPTVPGSEDHKPVVLDPGIYEVDIVRVYDYDWEETVRVVD